MLRWKSSLKPAAAAATGITLETSATTSATSYATPINIDVNIPAVSADDILLLFCTTTNESQPTDSPPSGWTKIDEQDGTSTSGATVAAYWKRASGSASATTETWSAFYPWGESYYIWVGAYSGCVTSVSPVDTDAGNAINYGSSVATSFTTNADNAMVVSMAGSYNKSATWSPSGEIVDTNYSGSEYVSVNGSIESSAGAKTATVTLSGNTRSTILTVALKDTAATGITLETSAENEDFTGYSSPYNFSVSYPAVSTNDIMLAILTTERRTDFNGTPPTGWTKVIETDGDNAQNSTQAVYWKRATGSASATSETWGGIVNSSQQYYTWVGAYSGCVTSVSPIDASAGSYQGYGTNWSQSITTQTDNAMVVAVAGSDNESRTFVWSDGTELVDKSYQSTASVSINEKIESTAGAKTRSGTISSAISGTMTAVALRDTAPTPLQTRTVTFTAIDVFTIDSDTGQEIWNAKLNQANVGNGLRLWNGSVAGSSGATASGTLWAFSSGGDCTTWWESYYIRVKQDPGTGTYSDWINWTDASGDIYTSCQPEYNNIGSAVTNYSGPGTWTTHASGFKYQVEIYSASNRP